MSSTAPTGFAPARLDNHADVPRALSLGGPGELSREPYFSCDDIRTSATWAGLADSIMGETVDGR